MSTICVLWWAVPFFAADTLVWLGFSVCLTMLYVTLSLRMADRVRRLTLVVERWKMLTAAARWLAHYNHGRSAALLEILAERGVESYWSIATALLDRAGSGWARQGNMGQVVPLRQVPIALREAMILHNQDVTSRWSSEYAVLVADGAIEAARVRQLEDALASVGALLEEEPPEADVCALARSAALSHDAAEKALRGTRAALRRRVGYILRAQDPEEILPSIY